MKFPLVEETLEKMGKMNEVDDSYLEELILGSKNPSIPPENEGVSSFCFPTPFVGATSETPLIPPPSKSAPGSKAKLKGKVHYHKSKGQQGGSIILTRAMKSQKVRWF